jgi:mono/diheme cytochrome c family protein
MKSVLTISSVAIVFFVTLSIYAERCSPDWRTHQLDYKEKLAGTYAQNNVPIAEPFPIKLRQIYLPEMNRVDRCITCHVAIEDPGFYDEMNPLKTHPGQHIDLHDTEKYGCTICHDGQGRATNWQEAAADTADVFWNKPILRNPYIEANCYRCHADLLNETPSYNRGKKRFESSGCLGCHQRDGKGGYLGPELRGIGDASDHIKAPQESFDAEILKKMNNNRNLAYIYESVRFPSAQPTETVMFDFKLPHQEARVITVYIKSLAEPIPEVQRLSQKLAYPMMIAEKGEKIFHLYCTACHGKNGRGGVNNPNYVNGFIPALNVLSQKMFLFEPEHRDAVITALETSRDLLQADPKPDVPGFFKVIAKYLSVKNIIANGRIVEKKEKEGPSPLNMPAWGRSLPEEEVAAVIAYLIST